MLLPVGEVIIEKEDHTADNPSQRIAKRSGGDGAEYPCRNKKVYLAENNKAEHHNHHRRGRVPGAAEGVGVNLIEADGEVKRHHQTNEVYAIGEVHPVPVPGKNASKQKENVFDLD